MTIVNVTVLLHLALGGNGMARPILTQNLPRRKNRSFTSASK